MVRVTINTRAAKVTLLIRPADRAVVANTNPGTPRGIRPNTTSQGSMPAARSAGRIARPQASLLSTASTVNRAARLQAFGSIRVARDSRRPTDRKYSGRNTSESSASTRDTSASTGRSRASSTPPQRAPSRLVRPLASPSQALPISRIRIARGLCGAGRPLRAQRSTAA